MSVDLLDPISRALSEGWKAPDFRPIVEWAEENIELPLTYAIPGKFQCGNSRHILAVFDALQDDSRSMVNVLKATQTFGTGIADIYCPWTIANAPGPIMWNWQTGDMAKQHSEARAMPVIRGCEVIKHLLPEDRHKKRNQEILFKNGAPLYIQGPAPGNLQGKSIRYLLNDEVWQWPAGRIREAIARVDAFKKAGTSKILNISQGGTVGDDWHKLCSKGDMFEWEVACPYCAEYQILCMEEKDTEGNTIYRMKWDKDGSNVFYECAHCRKPIYDSAAQRAAFNASGRYRQTRVGKTRDMVTFRWSSLIAKAWADLVEEYRECLAAKKVGALLPLKAFLQKVLAQFWDEKENIHVAPVSIVYADYIPCKRPPGPPGPDGAPVKDVDGVEPWAEEKFRFLTVDCQANFLEFWAVIRAWGPNESRRLWRGKLTSWEAVRQLQLEWNVRSQFVSIESGYRGSEVYRQCCRHVDETGRGWVAFKGRPQVDFVHTFKNKPSERRVYAEPGVGDHMLGLKNKDVEKWLTEISPHAVRLYQKGLLKCPLYLWSNPSVFDITANLRDGQGQAWLAPVSEQNSLEDRIYREHLAGEVKVPGHDARGKEIYEWHEVGPNHLWDAENLQTVCAIIAGVIPLPTIA